MKRKAILIESSNVAGQTPLPGARVDVENWNNFMKSTLGGAWSDSEITILRKPFSSEVESALNVAQDCYCFVAFSGHGCDGSVVLNDHLDDFSIGKLRPRTDRGVLIVDSCRGVASGRYNFSTRAVALANAVEVRSVIASNSLSGHATLFEGAILNRAYKAASLQSAWECAFTTITGIVEMLACAKGQGAQEDPNAGGYYTASLMASADVWNKSRSTSKVHTTKDAHDYAVSILPAQQTPEYSPGWLSYPFAVKE